MSDGYENLTEHEVAQETLRKELMSHSWLKRVARCSEGLAVYTHRKSEIGTARRYVPKEWQGYAVQVKHEPSR